MTQAVLDLGALHPKQTLAFESRATEILYGGAAGGGKSHLMRSGAITWMTEIPGLQVYLFRRIRGDLIKNHMEGPKGFRNLLAPWTTAGLVEIVENEMRWWNGSKLYLCHCKDPKDVYQYQGAEMHVLLIDELTQWLGDMYYYLRTRVRAPGLTVPPKYKGMFPRILCGANPGNVGHQFVKADWIDGHKPLEVWRATREQGGMLRQFIPARLEDNPTMAEDDPDYEQRLEGMGSADLVRAYRYGDWDVVAGAFFDNIRRDKHELPTFTPPKHWTRFRSMDWGSAKPFSVGWWVIVDEDSWLHDLMPGAAARGYGDRRIPRGALIRYREWYGVKHSADGKVIPNTGLRLSAEAVGRGIKIREAGEVIDEQLSRADPSLWKEDGGPSNAEKMLKCDEKNPQALVGPRFQPADNTRTTGWQHMYSRLAWEDVDDGEPMLFVMDCCTDWWRTVPALQHDSHRPEDVDSDMEDHAGDDSRYACMGRPVSRVPKPKQQTGPKPWTLDWVIQQDEARKGKRR